MTIGENARKSLDGDLHHCAKITSEQVKLIWHDIKLGTLKIREIAEKHNVKQTTVKNIKQGTNWNCVTGIPRKHKKSYQY